MAPVQRMIVARGVPVRPLVDMVAHELSSAIDGKYPAVVVVTHIDYVEVPTGAGDSMTLGAYYSGESLREFARLVSNALISVFPRQPVRHTKAMELLHLYGGDIEPTFTFGGENSGSGAGKREGMAEPEAPDLDIETEVKDLIKASDARTQAGFARVNGRLDRSDIRLGGIESIAAETTNEIRAIGDRIDGLDTRLREIADNTRKTAENTRDRTDPTGS